MKKLLCALISALMLLSAVCPVMAVDVSSSDATDLFDELETMMPDDSMERIAIWRIFKAYMIDGTNGIDTVIKALNGELILPASDAGFKNFIDQLKAPARQAQKEAFILLLNTYKAVPVEKRITSLGFFGGAGDTITTEIEMTKLTLNAEQATAAAAIYDRYVPATVQAEFEEHFYVSATNDVLDEDNFLMLLTAFNGEFRMTDSEDGDFVLESYDANFATNLATYNADVTEVNGVAIGTDSVEGQAYDILTGIVEFFNSFTDDIENLKVVLAHPEINLYIPNGTAATRPVASSGDEGSGGILGGGGGGIRPSKPEVEPDTPVPDDKLFNDIDGHWAEDIIIELAEKGIVAGYGDKTFKPDIGITRQEIAVIMTRALGLEEKAAEDKYAKADSGFADDDAIADWGRGPINLMVEMGIYTGYGDNEFKPEKIILRQEIVAVVMRYADQTEEGLEAAYHDNHEIHGYAESFIAHASELGIVNGYPDGTFKPVRSVTRAEAAKIIYGVIDFYKEIGKLK